MSEQTDSEWIWDAKRGGYYKEWTNEAGQIEQHWADEMPRDDPAPDEIPRGVESSFQNLSMEAEAGDFPDDLAYTDYTDAGGYPATGDDPQFTDSDVYALDQPGADQDLQAQVGGNGAQGPRDKGSGKAHAKKSSSRHDSDARKPGKDKDKHSAKKGSGKRSKKGKEPQQASPDASTGLQEEDEEAFEQARDRALDHAFQSYFPDGGGPSAEGAYEPALYKDENSVPQPEIYIADREGQPEPNDSRYRVEHSRMFQPGTVFKILWAEPSGYNSREHEKFTECEECNNKKGVHVGFRRFIVVASDSGHSTCVAVYTYTNQGCGKKGVKPDKHGIIYDTRSEKAPSLLRHEPVLGYRPVRMQITAPGEKLAKESRINYSKLFSIEHNLKVFILGYIQDEDFHIVSGAVDDCWYHKMKIKTR